MENAGAPPAASDPIASLKGKHDTDPAFSTEPGAQQPPTPAHPLLASASCCSARSLHFGNADADEAQATNRKAPRTRRTSTASAAVLEAVCALELAPREPASPPAAAAAAAALAAAGPSSGGAPWCDLPDDVLRRVLDRLPPHYARVTRLVCAGWQRATERSLRRARPEALAGGGGALARRFPNLRALDLSCCDAAVELADRGALSLRSLLRDASLAQLAGLRRLEALSLEGCRLLEGPGLRHLARLTSLRSLDLSNCAGLRDAGLAEGLSALPALTAVTLLGCGGLTDGCAAALLALPALARLAVPPRLTDAGLAALAAAPALQRVAIRGCAAVGPDGIAALLRAPRLQRVVVSRCALVTAKALDGVAPNLRVVACPLRSAPLPEGAPRLPLAAPAAPDAGGAGGGGHAPGAPAAGFSAAPGPPDMQLLMANFNG
jgi:hypothetical protein